MIKNRKNQICGLVGERLGHSFSPQIHGLLADYPYSLFEMPESQLESFIKSDRYHSVNVTIPYKMAVIPYLDVISEAAQKIGSVNTITHLPDGRLYGDNTDFYGFVYMIKNAGIDMSGKKVLILGTGGTSRTARAACENLGASEIRFVSRGGELNYENAHVKHPDTQIIVNCTPVGMYPNNLISPIDIEKFPALEGVADVIFNPAKTQLLLDAERLGLKIASGLPMLVAQAKRACEIFTGEEIDDGEIDRITGIISAQTSNIILVGMPGCGKTTIGTIISEKLSRELIDTDALVVELAGKTIPEIFSEDGEERFRQIEHEAIKLAGKKNGVVIATGGGVVTRSENYNPLCQNGKIVFITRDISTLAKDGRPLSLSGDLSEMYNSRLPLYRAFCDIEIANITPTDTAEKIIKWFLED